MGSQWTGGESSGQAPPSSLFRVLRLWLELEAEGLLFRGGTDVLWSPCSNANDPTWGTWSSYCISYCLEGRTVEIRRLVLFAIIASWCSVIHFFILVYKGKCKANLKPYKPGIKMFLVIGSLLHYCLHLVLTCVRHCFTVVQDTFRMDWI